MILTVTLNAAIDKRYVVEGYKVGEVNRVKECAYTASDEDLKYGVCDYVPSTPDTSDTPTEEIVVSIVGSDTLRIGKTKTWTVEFKDKDGNDIECSDWEWNIKADFDTSELHTQESELDIKITAQDDDSLVDESFLLQILSSDEIVIAKKEVQIVEGW